MNYYYGEHAREGQALPVTRTLTDDEPNLIIYSASNQNIVAVWISAND